MVKLQRVISYSISPGTIFPPEITRHLIRSGIKTMIRKYGRFRWECFRSKTVSHFKLSWRPTHGGAFRLVRFVFENLLIKMEASWNFARRYPCFASSKKILGHLEPLNRRKRQFHDRVKRKFVRKWRVLRSFSFNILQI